MTLLAPFAPHLTEELWAALGETESIHTLAYPTYDPDLATDETVTIGVQIDGKVRGEITIATDATEAEAVTAAEAVPSIAERLQGVTVTRTIYVPGRILNLLTR